MFPAKQKVSIAETEVLKYVYVVLMLKTGLEIG